MVTLKQSFYCVRCKQKRLAQVTSRTSKGKVDILRGTCPVCGTKMSMFAKKK